jgi:predicted DNA-binding transcriptional regulator YafY
MKISQIDRILEMILLLQRRPGYRAGELAERFGVSERTIYRDFALLEGKGYCIDLDAQHRHFLFTGEEEEALFTEEEARLILLTLSGAEATPLRDSIRQKLFLNGELSAAARFLTSQRAGEHVRQIQAAMDADRQVLLRGYQSASSGTASDRRVDPLVFTDNYRELRAWEHDSGQVKTYKITRIGQVELLAAAREVRELPPPPDIFGMSGGERQALRLHLSQRAWLILRDEFPAALPYCQEQAGRWPWRLEGEIQSLFAVGRFVLGLPGELEVEGPEALRAYVEAKRKP